jgi:protein SCO1/2
MIKLNQKIKLAIALILLSFALTFSYIKIKHENNFNPFNQKINSSVGSATLGDLNKNKFVLLYFGFLSCPDACPTTLSTIAAVFNELPKDTLDKISFLFVDLDPERDTPEKLKNYVAFFHPKILSLSMPTSELDLFTKYFGIAYMKVPVQSKMGYTIDHSTDIIIMSPNRKFLLPIEHGTPKNLIRLRLIKMIDDFNQSK